MPAVAAKPPGRLLRMLLLSSAALTASASAVVVDVSGNLSTDFNSVVGVGNSARLTANTKASWQGGTFAQNVDLNTSVFTID